MWSGSGPCLLLAFYDAEGAVSPFIRKDTLEHGGGQWSPTTFLPSVPAPCPSQDKRAYETPNPEDGRLPRL